PHPEISTPSLRDALPISTGTTPPNAVTAAEPVTPAMPAEPVTAATPEAVAAETYAEEAAEPPAEVPAPLDLTNPEALPQTAPADPLAAPGAMLAAANPVDTAGEKTTLAKVNTYFNGISTLVGNFVQIGPDGSRADG